VAEIVAADPSMPLMQEIKYNAEWNIVRVTMPS
jgi:hypothetical protein